jgi:hypothetical protein
MTSPSLSKNADEKELDAILAEYTTWRELLLNQESLGENRVNVFMAIVSGSFVGLALINQLTTYAEIIYFIDGAILLALLLIGIITFARMIERSITKNEYRINMNRIRRYLIERYPNTKEPIGAAIHDPSFAVKVFDRQKGRLGLTGLAPIVGVINSVIATVGIVALTRMILAVPTIWSLAAGMLTFLLVTLAQYRYLVNRAGKAKALAKSLEQKN